LLAALIRISLAATIVALTVVLFGFVLPSMNGARRPSPGEISDKVVQQGQATDLFWLDKKPFIYLAFNALASLFLVALGLWCLHRVFTYFCARLDDQGYWNRVIAKRNARHGHRS
jgi:hypothetical protein